MSTRISDGPLLLLLLLLTAGCGRVADQPGNAALAQAEAQIAAEDDSRIPCAHGDQPMQRTCTVEQTQGNDGLTLTLRHPDGGFRRLRVTRDGRGVIAADGANRAQVSVATPGSIDVTIGTDHYRLPATVRQP